MIGGEGGPGSPGKDVSAGGAGGPAHGAGVSADQKKIIDLVIERAEQACRYVLKHQNFGVDENREYVSGFTNSAEICEKAIRDQVERHILDDIARAVNNR